MEELFTQAYDAAKELIELAKLKPQQILVVGCSSSEICGAQIGKDSNLEAAKNVFGGIWKACNEHGIFLACQCCEHLNRALIMEEKCAEKYFLEPVNVIPQPKAGGSFATTAWNSFEKPCAVEHINAHAGIDIGDTLIGMHLRHVAVPVRLSLSTIGKARIVCARTRAKFIGGIRAIYDETKI